MTVIKGTKLTTVDKVKDASSVKGSGGIKAKYVKKTGKAAISCKASDTAELTMENGSTYTITFTVDQPKAVKEAKKLPIGGEIVTKTIKDLFNTDIDSGELSIDKQKHSQAALSGNSLMVDPKEKDSIRIQYKYLNKKYKLTMKVK